MKIGIVTFHHNLNCGAILQAFALQTQLEKLGHQVEFIDYRPEVTLGYKRFLSKSPIKTYYKLFDYYQKLKYAKLDNFNFVLKQSCERYRTIEELRSGAPMYDVLFCGSDQIWNLENKAVLPYAYLLDFGDKGTPRISFAASMNNAIVPEQLKTELKEKLLNFNVISVREEKSFDFISDLLKDTPKDVFQIHDPTFLLQAQDYAKIFDAQGSVEADVVSYILSNLSELQVKQLESFVTQSGLRWTNLRNPTSCIRIGQGRDLIVTPYQWLYQMNKADFVICSSFHAVVFSLLFHKKFIVVLPDQGPQKKGGNHRINTILKPMGLLGRCVSDLNENELTKIYNEEINWAQIDEHLDRFRKKGIDFLTSNLKSIHENK